MLPVQDTGDTSCFEGCVYLLSLQSRHHTVINHLTEALLSGSRVFVTLAATHRRRSLELLYEKSIKSLISTRPAWKRECGVRGEQLNSEKCLFSQRSPPVISPNRPDHEITSICLFNVRPQAESRSSGNNSWSVSDRRRITAQIASIGIKIADDNLEVAST